MRDNAFSAVQSEFVNNFVFTPREDSSIHRTEANVYATVHYAVETIDASMDNFRSMNDQIRMFPCEMDELLEFHHCSSCLCLLVIRETLHKFPGNFIPPP